MICVAPLAGLTSAQVQGEIMPFSSVLGITRVAMRMDEVMLFVPCHNHGEGDDDGRSLAFIKYLRCLRCTRYLDILSFSPKQADPQGSHLVNKITAVLGDAVISGQFHSEYVPSL